MNVIFLPNQVFSIHRNQEIDNFSYWVVEHSIKLLHPLKLALEFEIDMNHSASIIVLGLLFKIGNELC